jgi:hypothetical protein
LPTALPSYKETTDRNESAASQEKKHEAENQIEREHPDPRKYARMRRRQAKSKESAASQEKKRRAAGNQIDREHRAPRKIGAPQASQIEREHPEPKKNDAPQANQIERAHAASQQWRSAAQV